MSEGWVSSAVAEWLESVGAFWGDLQVGSAHHFAAHVFAPVAAAGWFPEESVQLEDCAVVEGVAPWLQQ